MEYKQEGSDRAAYGERLLGGLARLLRARGMRGLALTNLRLCQQFYHTYPTLLVQETAAWQQLCLPLPVEHRASC